ncbi:MULTISPECIES: ogr/Delta-like zinc finger family protein [Serratia]|uniref:ogr/Delta-like zinc finger family protein n=1 Tax=Serratia TaxID=613 RepID=UPI001EE5EF3D|nr:ogr/Delta-like zinc finger family protein [Serratia bockelmannii]
MMRCPLCTHASYTRTSRYITERTKEAYYQCQSLTCSCTFKTVESVDKILCQPIQAQPVDENAPPLSIASRGIPPPPRPKQPFSWLASLKLRVHA